MRVKVQGFLFGKLHSWSLTTQNLGRSFINLGHEVDFISTDGFEDKFCPPDLKPYVKEKPTGKYDLQLSYTMLHNFPQYLNQVYGGKRFAIWNYEYMGKNQSTKVLPEYAKYSKYVDLILPSSEFSKQIFLNMGVPEEKLVVVPHGVTIEKTNNQIKLKTKKKNRILLNIASAHKRKNLRGALSVFCQAFDKNSDVVLIAKVNPPDPNKKNAFDENFFEILKSCKQKGPNHAEIEVVTEYIENIGELYNAMKDGGGAAVHFSMTHAEAFFLPSLESIVYGLLNVIPNYGGQLDFCNEKNSLLINGNIIRVPREHVYWNYSPGLVHFEPNTEHAIELLRKAVFEYDSIINKFNLNMIETIKEFSWENAAKQILELV